MGALSNRKKESYCQHLVATTPVKSEAAKLAGFGNADSTNQYYANLGYKFSKDDEIQERIKELREENRATWGETLDLLVTHLVTGLTTDIRDVYTQKEQVDKDGNTYCERRVDWGTVNSMSRIEQMAFSGVDADGSPKFNREFFTNKLLNMFFDKNEVAEVEDENQILANLGVQSGGGSTNG